MRRIQVHVMHRTGCSFALSQVVRVCYLLFRALEHCGVLDTFLETNLADLGITNFHTENYRLPCQTGAAMSLSCCTLGEVKPPVPHKVPEWLESISASCLRADLQFLLSSSFVLHAVKLVASCAQKLRVQIRVLVALFQKSRNSNRGIIFPLSKKSVPSVALLAKGFKDWPASLDGSFLVPSATSNSASGPRSSEACQASSRKIAAKTKKSNNKCPTLLDRSVAMCCCESQFNLNVRLSCRIVHGRFLYADSVQEIVWNIS